VTKIVGQRRVGQHARQRRGQRLLPLGVEHEPGVGDQLGQRGAVGGDHGRAARHRLEHRSPKPSSSEGRTKAAAPE